MNAKKNVSMKTVTLLLAVVLLIGCVAGGTMAWLITTTDPVTNTFVAGQIGNLVLEETDTDSSTEGKQHNYTVIPGKAITKDPKISYTKATENDVGSVYIFVEVTGGSWTLGQDNKTYTADELSWEIAESWTHLSDNVFYMIAEETVSNQEIIKNNTITVGTSIEKGEDMDAAVTAANGLTFTAYAIQAEGFTGTNAASDAWAAAKPANP